MPVGVITGNRRTLEDEQTPCAPPGAAHRVTASTHCNPSRRPMPAGYIGSLSVLQTIVRVAEKLRQHNPDLVYGKLGSLLCLARSQPCCAC